MSKHANVRFNFNVDDHSYAPFKNDERSSEHQRLLEINTLTEKVKNTIPRDKQSKNKPKR